MSFLDHIENCNEYNIEKFVPLNISGQRVGWVKRILLPHFAVFPRFVTCSASGVEINTALDTPLVLTEAMSQIGSALTESGYTGPWCDERYAIGRRFGENLFELDRAVVPAFGARAYGLHLTGYVRDENGLSIWVPRRTSDRLTYPRKLDNTVAGGQPAQLSLYENLEKNPRCILLPRQGFFEFNNLLVKAEFLITDGGSNQEECFYLGTPCLLFRSETERSEGIGGNVVISNFDPTIIENFLLNYNSYRRQPIPAVFSPSRFIVDQLV